MTEISDLKRRVEAVGEKFGRLVEQESRYGERLSDLVNAVEEGFARSQKEVQTLKGELESARGELDSARGALESAQGELDSARGELDSARGEIDKLKQDLEAAREESQRRGGELEGVKSERDRLAGELDEAKEDSRQLRSMVLSLLEAVESGGTLDMGSAMRNLESRIDRIMTRSDGRVGIAPAAAGLGDTTGSGPLELPPAPAKSERADSEAADAVAPPPAPAAKEAPDVAAPAESAAHESGVGLKDVMDEIAAIAAEPLAPADPAKTEEPNALDRPEAAAETAPGNTDESAGAEAGKTAEPPSDDDLSAVNKIIQRISLLTGEFVEPSHKSSGAGQQKTGSSLKVGNGPGDSAKNKPAAKSS